MLLYYLQTLAESTQKLSDPLKQKHPEIDWLGIGGFRNRLVHGYLNINFEVVSGVIDNELPALKNVVKRLLNDLNLNNQP